MQSKRVGVRPQINISHPLAYFFFSPFWSGSTGLLNSKRKRSFILFFFFFWIWSFHCSFPSNHHIRHHSTVINLEPFMRWTSDMMFQEQYTTTCLWTRMRHHHRIFPETYRLMKVPEGYSRYTIILLPLYDLINNQWLATPTIQKNNKKHILIITLFRA